MLKQRIITGLILAILFLSCLFGLGESSFAGFIIIVAALCGWEWAGLCGFTTTRSRLLYSGVIFLLMVAFQLGLASETMMRVITLFAVLWWLVICISLYLQPIMSLQGRSFSMYYLVAGPLTLISAFLAAQYLRNADLIGSPWLLLYALALVWAMDIGAYFSGKKFGRNKLAPLISPGKTIEGVAGGVAAALILYLFALTVSSGSSVSAVTLFIATVLSSGVSVVGDLHESRAKRMVGIKDSGTILPGHGGLLDRLDSALASLPVFGFVLLWA